MEQEESGRVGAGLIKKKAISRRIEGPKKEQETGNSNGFHISLRNQSSTAVASRHVMYFLSELPSQLK